MNTKALILGGCLCGKVRYKISGSLLGADHCHCSMCRKQHGAAFSTYADFDINGFKWLKGEEITKIFESTSAAGWCFCSECGSTLAGTENRKITSITLATVDSDVDIKPDSHIFVRSKVNWHEINDDLPQYQERAPSK